MFYIDKTMVHMQIVIDLKCFAWFSGQLRVISKQRTHELKTDVIMPYAAGHCATPDLGFEQRVMEGHGFFLSFFLSPRRGEMPRCLQTVPASHFFFFVWQIGCEAFTTDAHIAKIISAKLPLWPARGTWQEPARTARSNRIFPGQCKLWQIPSSCIMRFPANLPNSRESGRVSLFQLRGMLSDWMMLKSQNPQPPPPPPLPSLPSCDHLVSSVFSYISSLCSRVRGSGW